MVNFVIQQSYNYLLTIYVNRISPVNYIFAKFRYRSQNQSIHVRYLPALCSRVAVVKSSRLKAKTLFLASSLSCDEVI